MIRTLQKIGDGYGLILDRAILELLEIGPGASLEVTVLPDGGGLSIRPVGETAAPATDEAHRERVRRSVDRVTTEHAETLRKLAE